MYNLQRPQSKSDCLFRYLIRSIIVMCKENTSKCEAWGGDGSTKNKYHSGAAIPSMKYGGHHIRPGSCRKKRNSRAEGGNYYLSLSGKYIESCQSIAAPELRRADF